MEGAPHQKVDLPNFLLSIYHIYNTMEIDPSDFISESSGNASDWSFDTPWFHLTRHQVGGRLLLRKSLKSEFLGDARLRETLKKEYAIGSILGMETEYVVSYYQLVDTLDECYLTMDFVEGLTLAEQVMTDPEFLSRRRNFEYTFLQFLEAVRTIHHHQVVHLDLKPSNIMLTHVNHDVRIIDLGFCYADAFPDSMGMTNAFAAPEQLDGSGDVDARTDIYCVGKIIEWMIAQLGDRCQWRKDRVVKKIISRCLAEQKKDRWQKVDEIIDFMVQSRSSKKRTSALISAILLLSVFAIPYFIFSIPVRSSDKHVLYGNFSLLNRTCEAVGKITDDYEDQYWEGNLYIYPEIRHWGMDFKVTSIADNAFLEDTTFSTVSLPSTLKRIGSQAFQRCIHLEAIHIPEGVEMIGASAFWRDSCLAKVQLPSTLKVIPSACFHLCAFSSVIVPEGVEEIDLDAFAVCSNLHEVSLPSTLKRIGRGVFWRCDSLKSISLPASLQSIGEYAFYECTNLKQVENHATDPQPVMSLFKDSISDIHLFVPLESVDRYKQSPGWNQLMIEPLSIQ